MGIRQPKILKSKKGKFVSCRDFHGYTFQFLNIAAKLDFYLSFRENWSL